MATMFNDRTNRTRDRGQEPCFACGRAISGRQYWVITEDGGQTVMVGRNCYNEVRKADKAGGYQPPDGGPKLFLIGSKG